MPANIDSNTRLPDPSPVNVPGALVTNPGALGPKMYTAPAGVNVIQRTHVGPKQPYYPSNVAAAQDEFADTPPPLAGETRWESKGGVPVRHTQQTNAFLEQTVQSISDEVVREMGFKILDETELEVTESGDPHSLALRNKKSPEKVIVLSEQEFIDALKFFGDRAAPLLVKAAPKTKEFIKILDKRPPLFNFQPSYLTSHDTPDFNMSNNAFERMVDREGEGLSEKQQEEYKKEIAYQATLDYYRDKLEPVRSIQRSRDWGQWAKSLTSFGMLGKPHAVMSVENIVQGMEGAKNAQKAEAKIILEDMRAFGFLNWDESGVVLQPSTEPGQPTRAIPDSNIQNLVNNVLSPAKIEARGAPSRYQPIGEEFFTSSFIKAMHAREISVRGNESPLSELLLASSGTNRTTPFKKVKTGQWDALEIARYFGPYVLGFLHITYPLWIAFVLSLPPITLENLGKLMQHLSAFLPVNRATGAMLEYFGPAMESVLPASAVGEIKQIALTYGDEVEKAAIVSIHSALYALGAGAAAFVSYALDRVRRR